jgi:hypothetical protein
MKIKLLILSVLLIAAGQSLHAQSKKELESSLNAATASKDSIQKLLTGLTVKYDSVHKAFLAYDAMYKTIKEKLVTHGFEPKNMGEILDSLKLENDTVIAKIKARMTGLKDTVQTLNHLNDSLKTDIGHLKFMVSQFMGKGTVPATQKDLTGTWALTLKWYELANDSIKSGIILMPVPTEYNIVTQIIFLDVETATVIYSKGDSIKCFYKVNSFAQNKPWSIDLNRGNEVNIRLNVNASGGELFASYRMPKGYFYGYMRKQ